MLTAINPYSTTFPIMARPRKYLLGYKTEVVPCRLSEALINEIRQIGIAANASLAGSSVTAQDIMRQAIIIGLPKVRAAYASFNK